MFGGLGLSGMQGEVRLGADRYFQSLSLNLPDRSLSLELKPHGKTLDIVLAGGGLASVRRLSVSIYFR